MRFLVATVKGNKNLVRIDFEGKIGQRWAETSEAVVNFAQKTFKGSNQHTGFPGDEVDVEYTVKNGKYEVTRITKKGQGGTQTSQQSEYKGEYICEDCGAVLKDGKYKKCYNCNQKSKTEKPQETKKPTCIDCGKELKDDKYEKCYACNQKNPSKPIGTGKKYYGKSPEESEKIKRLSILSSTCNAIQTLTGQIELSSLGDIITELYDKLYKKISE